MEGWLILSMFLKKKGRKKLKIYEGKKIKRLIWITLNWMNEKTQVNCEHNFQLLFSSCACHLKIPCDKQEQKNGREIKKGKKNSTTETINMA